MHNITSYFAPICHIQYTFFIFIYVRLCKYFRSNIINKTAGANTYHCWGSKKINQVEWPSNRLMIWWKSNERTFLIRLTMSCIARTRNFMRSKNNAFSLLQANTLYIHNLKYGFINVLDCILAQIKFYVSANKSD